MNALLVRGTEDGIDEFIEWLKLIDRKPQQIIVEIQSLQISRTNKKDFGIDWFYNIGALSIIPHGFGLAPDASTISIGYAPPDTPNFRAILGYLTSQGGGRVTDAIRIATMNLMPAYNSTTTTYPYITMIGLRSGHGPQSDCGADSDAPADPHHEQHRYAAHQRGRHHHYGHPLPETAHRTVRAAADRRRRHAQPDPGHLLHGALHHAQCA
jgi:hypothetical protein